MKKQLFSELVESIQQAGQIHRGEKPPSRRFVFKPEALNPRETSEVSKRVRANDRGHCVDTSELGARQAATARSSEGAARRRGESTQRRR
jgi:hypothetical protein